MYITVQKYLWGLFNWLLYIGHCSCLEQPTFSVLRMSAINNSGCQQHKWSTQLSLYSGRAVCALYLAPMEDTPCIASEQRLELPTPPIHMPLAHTYSTPNYQYIDLVQARSIRRQVCTYQTIDIAMEAREKEYSTTHWEKNVSSSIIVDPNQLCFAKIQVNLPTLCSIVPCMFENESIILCVGAYTIVVMCMKTTAMVAHTIGIHCYRYH